MPETLIFDGQEGPFLLIAIIIIFDVYIYINQLYHVNIEKERGK